LNPDRVTKRPKPAALQRVFCFLGRGALAHQRPQNKKTGRPRRPGFGSRNL